MVYKYLGDYSLLITLGFIKPYENITNLFAYFFNYKSILLNHFHSLYFDING